MAETRAVVRSLLIPLTSHDLLVPSGAVAEIVQYDAPLPPEGDTPVWLLGRFSWRGLLLPLISLEMAAGASAPDDPARRQRIAVFNSIVGDPRLPFYALVITGIPHMIQAAIELVQPLEETNVRGYLALQCVKVAGARAFIPDLERIESMLHSARVEVTDDLSANVE